MNVEQRYQEALNALIGLSRSIGVVVATEGQAAAASTGDAPQPDKIYILVVSGPCWVTTDGTTAVTRTQPARFVDSWIILAGQGEALSVVADALAGSGAAVVGSIEGPISRELAIALVFADSQARGV